MSILNMAEAHEGLPKQFVASLKILFDILDEEHTGLIRLRDIESRWSDEGVRDLPTGVMEGLRKVVPPNGFLSFDCFVAGLKFALFQGKDPVKRYSVSAGSGGGGVTMIQKENRSPAGSAPLSTRHFSSPATHPLQSDPGNRQQGSSVSDTNKQGGGGTQRSAIPYLQKTQSDARPATAAVRPQPNNATNGISYRRNNTNLPYPNPPPPSSDSSHPTPGYPQSARQGHPPPRPERSPHSPQVRKSASGSELNPPQVPPRDQRQNQKIVNDLKNWQRDWSGSSSKGGSGHSRGVRDRPHPSTDDPQHAIYANIDQFQKKQEESQSGHSPGKTTVRRHGSGRRHTLQNGVDQNMIKRMQQLDEESAMLKHGLEMVDMARDWYLRQLAAMQDKQRMLGKVNYNDNSLEAHQERMNFQRARISEVNMQLRTLVDSSEKGFPLHMNLALPMTKGRNSGTGSFNDATMQMIREQNRRLTQEVNERSDKISKLEQEKASLIRELFESRSKHKSNYDDTTFM